MRKKKKSISAKWVFAIIMAVILSLSSVYAVIYVQNILKPIVPAVHVGDTFSYSVTGAYITFTSGANPDEQYSGITEMNQTNYYKVTVTAIRGTVVSLSTDWVFRNGTDLNQAQTINVANGQLENTTGFWGLYAPNLRINDLLCPKGGDSDIRVNDTITRTYADSSRPTNYWWTTSEWSSLLDPTNSTHKLSTVDVLFDKQTGIMTAMTNFIQFDNPQMNLDITWTLTSCTLWKV